MLAVTGRPGEETAERLAARLRDVGEAAGPDVSITVAWGMAAPQPGGITLNPRPGLDNLADRETARQILRLSGVRTTRRLTPDLRGVRGYRIHVCDLEPLLVFKRDRRGKLSEVSRAGLPAAEKLFRAAVRAVYGLGLDFGAVHAAIPPRGSPVIHWVDPAPRLDGESLDAWARALRGLAARRLAAVQARREGRRPAASSALLLGADPEFMLQDTRTRHMVAASVFFPREGDVGCDDRVLRRSQGICYPLAEVRPRPEACPDELLRGIRGALNRALELAPYRNIKWLAGSMPFKGFPIGGHVHFGNMRPSTDLLRALDSYLAVPMMLVEKPDTARQRRRRYGFPGDFRLQRHGFEYRTLSSWLVSPAAARAVLALARIIALDHDLLSRRVFDSVEAQRCFSRGRKSYFRILFPELWADVLALPACGPGVPELEPLRRLISGERRWREEADLRRQWKLPLPRDWWSPPDEQDAADPA